ncbi:MAG: hypothetical protein AVDCRST_MAG24-1424 [uncultured Nocardioidaceae bacterium]|uniref:Uncharacterized protein n=1 Tax=uncultured Nocardioidaceae bacterium TaxID=253824 RepID=A0A6J4LXH4_9ACTN|nr:MAG: hypothetical protein AVDCRST_MAG24-1424 [uncultured Nocardioidaceae bacterium]
MGRPQLVGTLTTVTVLTQPDSPPRSRPALRGVRTAALSAGLVLGSWVTSAVAAPPQGWENATNDSMLMSLLKMLGIPLLVIAVITLLTYLPLMMRGGRKSADPVSYFAEHSEWFGGPRTTPEAVEAGAAGQVASRGGASARF